jgi:hypothetical protein
MSPTILPEIVRCNLAPMRRALDTYEVSNGTPESTDELLFLISFLVDAIERYWAFSQSELRKGVEGRVVSVGLKDVLGSAEVILPAYEKLQRALDAIPDHLATEIKINLSRVDTDVKRVERVIGRMASLLNLLNTSAPPIDLEKLKTLEAGPFVRLEDLRSGRRT